MTGCCFALAARADSGLGAQAARVDLEALALPVSLVQLALEFPAAGLKRAGLADRAQEAEAAAQVGAGSVEAASAEEGSAAGVGAAFRAADGADAEGSAVTPIHSEMRGAIAAANTTAISR